MVRNWSTFLEETSKLLIAPDETYTLVVYDRSGKEVFRSPCSGTFDGEGTWITSRDVPDRDLDDTGLCWILGENDAKVIWFEDMGDFAADKPVVLPFYLRD
jgi:hypothetical protein